MKILTLLAALLCVVICSCSQILKVRLSGVGADPTWISNDETRQVGMQLLTNRYPNAQIVTSIGEGQICKYLFTTNGANVPVVVVVDRKTGKARFENVSK